VMTQHSDANASAPRGDRLAELLAAGLGRLAGRHSSLVTEVRGQGLLWGLEFVTPAVAGHVLMELGRSGLVVSPCLGRPEVLRLLPPLVASDDEIEEAFAVLDTVCGAVPEEFLGVAPSALPAS
ncbi:aminotransferase class III-fold pyridoxal phosphate-dependent enzyme, partial [Streptomyces sp. SM12]|uniref:aminotransferase class III-fold pyridoxal phosphate-dependent enzyme n=1 Tax=Streptomyces sp. SM12 TaxID=1071602 RepID=UPI0011AFF714